jgi:hypothetical protein
MVLPDKIRHLPAGGFHERRSLDPRRKRRLLGPNHLGAGQNAHTRTMNARPRQEKKIREMDVMDCFHGLITLPPEIRRALGLESAEHPMMLAELREGGVLFLML